MLVSDLPDGLYHARGGDRPIPCQQRDLMDFGGGGDDPVKGIAVVGWSRSSAVAIICALKQPRIEAVE